MSFRYAEEPLDIGPLLDSGIRLFRFVFKRLIPIVALMIIVAVIQSLVFQSAGLGMVQDGEFDFSPLLFVSIFVSSIVQYLLYAAAIYRCHYIVEDEDKGLVSSLLAGAKKVLPIVLMFIMYMLVVMLGMILLIIPGLILTVSLMLAIYAIVLEDKGPVESLKRSYQLVKGNWWRTSAIVGVATIVAVGVYFIIAFLTGFLAAMAVGDSELITMVAELIVSALSPFIQLLFIVIIMVLYHDLRLRLEGADLDAAIDEL